MSDINNEYSETGFWEKLKNFALAAGSELVEKALWLYYAAQRSETPVWAKTIIFGALAYFISPIDAIPDAIPIVGFSDDLGAIAAAIGMVSLYITDEVKGQASQKMQDWFGKKI
ncbi:MAG: YkvA family protein [Thiobacillus sp.]|nr:YkvA family protein [Thiobacillus sp.]